MKSILTSISALSIILLFGCGNEKPTDTKAINEDQPKVSEKTDTLSHEIEVADSITLVPLTGSPEYPDAKLTMKKPERFSDAPVKFDFDVEGYELGVQTADASGKGLANSDKGQHIHLILNNGPYSAHYEPNFEKELKPGDYVSLAFLSRSYHESVKSADAFEISKFTVGEGGPEVAFDPEAPHMFYSRPKGTYKGNDAKRILLDFFLMNVDLSEDGYKVRVSVNGEYFTLTKWQPYIIEGAPMGEMIVALTLLDSEDMPVESPFSPVKRIVTLEP